MNHLTENILDWAKEVIEIEKQALEHVCQNALNSEFQKAVSIIFSLKGKLIISGIGKSGLIGQKLASTFSSLGIPAFFLHPAEALHGDLGVLDIQDALMGISYSGQTQELVPVFTYGVKLGVSRILLTASKKGPLVDLADVILDITVPKEACPLNLAPTASSTATLALGDAMAICISRLKGFTADDFRQRHPGGGIGKRLLKVADLMHVGQAVPKLAPDTPVTEILVTMSQAEVRGAVVIVDEDEKVLGIITDGDLRRRFTQLVKPDTRAKDLMTTHPKCIGPESFAVKALDIMRKHQISVLVVVDDQNRAVGIIHIQDLIRHVAHLDDSNQNMSSSL